MTQAEYNELQKGDPLYFARVMPRSGYYEIHDVIMVTKYDDHCTVCELKTKQSFMFNQNDIYQRLYLNREEALEYLKEQQEKNKNMKVYSKKKEKSTESEE